MIDIKEWEKLALNEDCKWIEAPSEARFSLVDVMDESQCPYDEKVYRYALLATV